MSFVNRLLAVLLLIFVAYPLTLFLHPWWILTQPFVAIDLFSTMVDEVTTVMHLPCHLSATVQTGQWWWNL